MRCLKAATALFLFVCAGVSNAYADDFGPRHDVGSIRADAQRLLAHRARLANVDPKNIVLSDVVVAGDQAMLSWDIGKQHGFMGLVRNTNRWWDALDVQLRPSDGCWIGRASYPLPVEAHHIDSHPPHPAELVRIGFLQNLANAAANHNRDVRDLNSRAFTESMRRRCVTDTYVPQNNPAVRPGGGTPPSAVLNTAPYGFAIAYAANNAAGDAIFKLIYARPPTAAEFLPYPTPFRYVSDAVVFFDIIIDAPKPVSFQKGGMFDVWFPFVLDDALKYRLSFGGGQEPIGPIVGTIFDNVLHFDLPGFTALPGKELMGEIDGDLH